MRNGPKYALGLAILMFVVDLLVASYEVCRGPSYAQVCGPLYRDVGDIFLVFGGLFLLVWVILTAVDEFHFS